MAKKNFKIRNSKGEPYLTCPIIDQINSLLLSCNIPTETMFDISMHLATIRELAKIWQHEEPYCSKKVEDLLSQARHYNYSAALNRIRFAIQNGTITEEKFDNILNTYM